MTGHRSQVNTASDQAEEYGTPLILYPLISQQVAQLQCLEAEEPEMLNPTEEENS